MYLSSKILQLADLIITDIEFFYGNAGLKTCYLLDLVRVEMQLFKHKTITEVFNVGDAIFAKVQVAQGYHRHEAIFDL